MREAGRLALGFFPCPPEAVSVALARLQAASPACTILDPCSGLGAAVGQLGASLGLLPESIFAVELEEGRAAALNEALPGSNILAPASIFGCQASWGSFGLCFVNPPFDDQYGGGRTEDAWLKHVLHWIAPGGILCLICPERVVRSDYTKTCCTLREWFTDVSITPFPAKCRKFEEVIVLAVKRGKPYEPPKHLRGYGDNMASWTRIQAPPGFVYRIPACTPPRKFVKVEPTEEELASALAASPLRQRWSAVEESKMVSPPLALGTGHVALLLASGHLDGVISPEGESPHLVRGTSRKVEYVASEEVTENADGSQTTKTVKSEKIELIVRAVDLSGHLFTFGKDEEDAKDNA